MGEPFGPGFPLLLLARFSLRGNRSNPSRSGNANFHLRKPNIPHNLFDKSLYICIVILREGYSNKWLTTREDLICDLRITICDLLVCNSILPLFPADKTKNHE
ncbi:MAG: hypothetical protein A2W90_13050 [Bacteroidetes bacterium GWF2_42_66]|nr:MAG: hypothetical protein A2W92_19440 [Bacteroidetes bacterium GWA2_42_15]OFY00148.1 MAG: hypothetical protein A2W89_18040 [Bacteroidetes bacterium GWE2_42_39]OFY40290.1 MAG: hypothetical protein A2W90_13050 [Bacteroidetes bacterium GWF2_42_66]HBL73729.1 hypothetical protein [Prolixibacteraceae bacterium]HCR91192.1 hypothetical protein [Prolixibacteraceae bacterium]